MKIETITESGVMIAVVSGRKRDGRSGLRWKKDCSASIFYFEHRPCRNSSITG